MIVECKITKELFYNKQSAYRVLSCMPLHDYPDLVTNDYHSFSISGTQLNTYEVNKTYELEIKQDDNEKYPWSYIITGIPGINPTDGNIEVNPDKEYSILCRYMQPVQAKRCNEAYPNFVSLILNNREKEIDIANIYNVGSKRFNSYIEKIKQDCSTILFYAVTSLYQITKDNDINIISKEYVTPKNFEHAINFMPYEVYCKKLGWSFKKADVIVLKKWPDKIDSEERCIYAVYDFLKQNEAEGNTKIFANTLAKIVYNEYPEIKKHIVNVIKTNELFYFDELTKYVSIRKTRLYEENIAKNIKNRLAGKNYDYLAVKDWEKYRTLGNAELTNEQLSVLKLAFEKNIIMLTAPGGAGKSFTTKAIISLLEDTNHTYTLLAPTGIAAKKIREYTGRSASTIHKYLLKEYEYTEYVIIDEMSMVGVELLSTLFNFIDSQTKIIFICDEAQLPSISPGNIVQNIINSESVPSIKLTKIFRYGIGGISTIATDFRLGSIEHLIEAYSDYAWYEIEKNPLEQILTLYQSLLEHGYTQDDIMIICPMNVGSNGTYVINNAIQEQYNDNESLLTITHNDVKISIKKADKILNTKNNYEGVIVDYDDFGDLEEIGLAPIMNGDIGHVKLIESNEKEDIIYAEFDEQLFKLEKNDLSNLLLGYCMTIHRVQGAQNKVVIAYLPYSHMLTRNLLYVAASRAQEKLIIISTQQAIGYALEIQENNERETWLEELLKYKEM